MSNRNSKKNKGSSARAVQQQQQQQPHQLLPDNDDSAASVSASVTASAAFLPTQAPGAASTIPLSSSSSSSSSSSYALADAADLSFAHSPAGVAPRSLLSASASTSAAGASAGAGAGPSTAPSAATGYPGLYAAAAAADNAAAGSGTATAETLYLARHAAGAQGHGGGGVVLVPGSALPTITAAGSAAPLYGAPGFNGDSFGGHSTRHGNSGLYLQSGVSDFGGAVSPYNNAALFTLNANASSDISSGGNNNNSSGNTNSSNTGGARPSVVGARARAGVAGHSDSRSATAHYGGAASYGGGDGMTMTVTLNSNSANDGELGGDFVVARDAILTAAQDDAQRLLLQRVKGLCAAHLVALALLVYSKLWPVSLFSYLGFLCAGAYWQQFHLQRAKAVAILGAVLLLSWLGVVTACIYFLAYPVTALAWYDTIALCAVVVDAVVVVPVALYNAFWLHRSYSFMLMAF
mgnify:CR=1 FL=1